MLYRTLALLATLCASIHTVSGYEALFSDKDYSRQVCSGMWGGSTPYINVTFDPTSQGQVAMVIYEWSDVKYLGKVTSVSDDSLPQKTYVCTSDAARAGFCTDSELGLFILDLPEGKTVEQTSYWSARVGFPGSTSTSSSSVTRRQNDTAVPNGIMNYNSPIHYAVPKTGYYCVAIVPVTVVRSIRQVSTDVPFHPEYSGTVLFRNTFNGELPATDYPKVNFYFAMFLLYAVLGGAWGWLCYRHVQELLPIQYYLSSLIALVNIEMLANWAYYRYLNHNGEGTASTVFLFVVAILDAGRNALSFFLLLVVSLGLSVVRESLGRTMLRCQILAGAHFVFGVLYAVGIVELELESTSALILLLFVIPLAFTLSGFLLWIMYALNGTIAQLAARKQRFKLGMFRTLHRILLATSLVILAFFVVSSMTFSNRLAEDYAANTWKVRWWLLDGWLALLYLAAFAAIAWLWRPTGHNRRLQMSDEIAQDEEEAEDYDLESLEHRTAARTGGDDDDDAATLVGRGGPQEDVVVFEIGDADDGSDGEDSETPKKRRAEPRRSDSTPQNGHGRLSGEHEGLMSSRNRDD